MNIIITLPKKIKWQSYQKELDAVEDFQQVINFKVPHFPTKTVPGERCYLVHNGMIQGWMKIVEFLEHEFTCAKTRIDWMGNFIQRAGKFHYIEPIEMKGFQGWRYFNQKTVDKII